jgi:hypothetical protein
VNLDYAAVFEAMSPLTPPAHTHPSDQELSASWEIPTAEHLRNVQSLVAYRMSISFALTAFVSLSNPMRETSNSLSTHILYDVPAISFRGSFYAPRLLVDVDLPHHDSSDPFFPTLRTARAVYVRSKYS